jgi:hypothetical protein
MRQPLEMMDSLTAAASERSRNELKSRDVQSVGRDARSTSSEMVPLPVAGEPHPSSMLYAYTVMGVTERSRREKHEPHFAPQSGWYKPGIMTPGSLRDREEMREASIPYSVVVLRRRGARIPATELLRCEPATGRLI